MDGDDTLNPPGYGQLVLDGQPHSTKKTSDSSKLILSLPA